MYEEESTPMFQHHLKHHESHSCDRNGKSEVGGHSRKVWVEVCCQGQTMLTLLKTKIVHLFPLLNQETLCYEPDSFLFHTQIQQFFENDIMKLFSSTYPLRLNKRVPPRIGI